MIVVRIELHGARGGKPREIGRMYIANHGHRTAQTGGKRGDYLAAVCRRGTTEAPRELYENIPDPDVGLLPKAQRTGKVLDFPRQSYSVWRLVLRCLRACFHEERS